MDFQPVHDLLKPPEGDALLPVLESEQGRRRQAGLFRELGIAHLSAFLLQEVGELFFEFEGGNFWHLLMMRPHSFRMRNFFLKIPHPELIFDTKCPPNLH